MTRKILIALGAILTTTLGIPTGTSALSSFTEDFTTATYEDTVHTTADWNTGVGELRLHPFSPTLVGTYAATGAVFDLSIDGNYAFLAVDVVGLHVVDISDPANPTLLGTYDTPNSASEVFVTGNLAFVADGSSGLLVLDVSNPAAPALLGTRDTPGFARGVFVAGDHAFVADGTSGLQVIDIRNPTSPTLSGTFNTSGSAFQVHVAGDHAFVADGTSGLVVIDVSNPVNPIPAGSYDTPDAAYAVFVDGDHAFVADGASGLLVLDVGDPASPALLGTYDTPGTALGVFAEGDRAFVGDDSSGLQVLDISDPANPVPANTYDTPGFAQGVALAGDHVFVADNGGGLQVIRIREPHDPTPVGFQGTADTPVDVAVAGDLAFVSVGPAGLEVFDVSDPASPVPMGGLNVSGSARGVFVDGGHAFLAVEGVGLQVIDVGNPASPTVLGTYASSLARDVFVTGDHAYLVDGQSGLLVLDVSDPATPTLEGSRSLPGDAPAVFVAGQHAFVADGSVANSLEVIDVSDPANPTLVGTGNLSFAADVVVEGDLALVAAQHLGLLALDISTPASPVVVGIVVTPGDATGVHVTGDYAFVADANGVQVIDISNPANLTSIGSYSLLGGANKVVVAGDHAFAANRNGFGLLPYRVFQGDVNAGDNVGQSVAIDGANDAIIRARLSTTQTSGVSWSVSADGGGDWQAIGPGGDWSLFAIPGNELVWKSTLAWSPLTEAPAVSNLQIDWLNDFARVAAVSDVPDDQGKQVRVEWLRSGHDFVGDATQIVEYAVYRRIDTALREPSGGIGHPRLLHASAAVRQHARRMMAAGWDFLTTVPVRVEDEYAVVVPTLADSTIAGGRHFTTFMVSALTATPGVFFDSPPDSGYSVDNLAPSAPSSLSLAGGSLSWDIAPDPDFDYHTVYGSTSSTLDETAIRLGYAIDPTFDVMSTPFAYYHVTTSDVAGNESAPASLGDTANDVSPQMAAATRFAMRTPRPNPSRGNVGIGFDLPRDGSVQVTVYDTSGRQVRTVGSDFRAAGRHEVSWDGEDDAGRRVAAGVYFVRVEAGKFRASRRMVILR